MSEVFIPEEGITKGLTIGEAVLSVKIPIALCIPVL